MNTLARGIEAIKDSEGKSTAHVLMRMAQAIYPEGDPERLFREWIYEWEGDLKEGIVSLGLEAPPVGPKLLQRIQELVTPVLVDTWQAEHAAAKEGNDD